MTPEFAPSAPCDKCSARPSARQTHTLPSGRTCHLGKPAPASRLHIMDVAPFETRSTNTPPAPLDHKFVGDIAGVFYVPGYQRGYRWDTTDVTRLLDDIWNNQEPFYNLQPVVVKLYQRGSEGQAHTWELVDGQQRLTTLYLIFLYMNTTGLNRSELPYEVHYQTRPGSQAYLKSLNADEHERNIDYYHLYKAYKCIGEWFDSHGNRRQYAANKFYEALFDKVRVIWYEAPHNIDSTALFTRLNVGRIPLTDAELVKALLLSKVSAEQTLRAQEVASQWDVIERDLHSPELWGFVAGSDNRKEEDRYPTRISLLLDTLAPAPKGHPPGRKLPRYHTFEVLRKAIEDAPIQFWEGVLNLHDLILGWFNNRSLYHKVGYLVATGTAFGELARLAHAQKKSQVESQLDQRMRASLSLRASDIEALSYANKSDYDKLLRLLLLMNVETMRLTPHSNQRFPFHLHAGTTWSLEHIHAQNAETLTKSEQWHAWLQQHLMALRALAPETVAEQAELVADIDLALPQAKTTNNFGPIFQALVARVFKAFNPPNEQGAPTVQNVHSIGNLALLSKADNSLLSNSVFEVKRQNVLAVDRKGGYIPVCTRNVFLKYYTAADAHQNHFWSLQDREHYLTAITDTVKKYLQPEEQ